MRRVLLVAIALGACAACAGILGIGDVKDDPSDAAVSLTGGFTLAAGRPSYLVRPGGTVSVDVAIDRSPGYGGPLKLHLAGLGGGLSAADVDAPPGATTATIPIMADMTAALGRQSLTVVGAGDSALANTSKPFALDVEGLPGTLDPTFGTGGTTTLALAAGDLVVGGALDPSGGVIVVGVKAGRWLLARFGPDGAIDPAFGPPKSIPNADGGGGLFSAYVDGAGRIVAAGYVGAFPAYSRAVVRFTATGELDTSFGGKGYVVLSDNPPSSGLVVAESAGELVAFAEGAQAGHSIMLVDRFAVDGGPGSPFPANNAPSFAVNKPAGADEAMMGAALYTFDGGPPRYALAAEKSGAVTTGPLVRGWLGVLASETGAWDVSINPSSPHAGVSQGRIDLPTLEAARAVAVRVSPLGFAVTGEGQGTAPQDGKVVMIRGDGLGDETFVGGAGATLTIPGGFFAPRTIQFDGAGNLIVGGNAVTSGKSAFVVTRLSGNGVKDAAFGAGGVVTIAVGENDDLRALAQDVAGRLVLIGSSQAGGAGDAGAIPSIALARVFP